MVYSVPPCTLELLAEIVQEDCLNLLCSSKSLVHTAA